MATDGTTNTGAWAPPIVDPKLPLTPGLLAQLTASLTARDRMANSFPRFSFSHGYPPPPGAPSGWGGPLAGLPPLPLKRDPGGLLGTVLPSSRTVDTGQLQHWVNPLLGGGGGGTTPPAPTPPPADTRYIESVSPWTAAGSARRYAGSTDATANFVDNYLTAHPEQTSYNAFTGQQEALTPANRDQLYNSLLYSNQQGMMSAGNWTVPDPTSPNFSYGLDLTNSFWVPDPTPKP